MPLIKQIPPQPLLRTLLALAPLVVLAGQLQELWRENISMALICISVVLWAWRRKRIAQLLNGAALLIVLSLFTDTGHSGHIVYPLSLLFSAVAALLLTTEKTALRLTSGGLSLLAVILGVTSLFFNQLALAPLNPVMDAFSHVGDTSWAPSFTACMVFLQLQRWPTKQHPYFDAAVLTPLPLLLGVILTVYVALLAEQQYQQQLQQQLAQRSDQLANDLGARLTNQNQALQRLARRWEQMEAMPQNLWQRQTQMLMQDFDNFYSIEWIDNELMIRWLEPAFADKNILNFRFEPDHPAYPYLMLARTTQQQVTSGIYRLIPGDLGFTVYTPIFINPEQQQGFLVSVYQLEPFITHILRNPIYTDISLRVMYRGQESYRSPGFDGQSQFTQQITLPAPLNWELQIQPKLEHLGLQQHVTVSLVLISGLFMSGLLGVSLWLISRYLRQQVKMQASNRQLKAEVSQREATTASLLSTNRKMALFYDLIDQARDALLVVNPEDHELIYYNSSTYKVLGYDEQAFLKAIKQTSGDLQQALNELIDRAQTCRRRFGSAVYEMELPRQDLSMLPVEVSVRTVKTEDNPYLTIVLHDVTTHRELQRRLLEMATKDALTQINNRRQFDTKLKTEWARMLRSQEPLSLLMMDVDLFKDYNDTLGHQQGDNCLRTIAELLQSALTRASDSAARYGGEEFVAILPHTDQRGAEQVAERVHQKLAQAAIPHPSSHIQSHVTLSVGICTITPHSLSSIEELIQRTDQALYQAKHDGRNRTVVSQLPSSEQG